MPKEKNKNLIRLIKDDIGGQNMEEFIGLRAKTYIYLKDNSDEDKKQRAQKGYVNKRKLKYQDHKNCLEAGQIENKINHLEKSKIDIDSPKEFMKK